MPTDSSHRPESERRRPGPDLTDLDAQQQLVHDRIVDGPRGRFGGPFLALLDSPDLCDRVQRLGVCVRFESSLPGPLRELAILTAASHWRAEFEWFAHSEVAREEGLPEAVLEAIPSGELPASAGVQEQIVHGAARDLVTTGRIGDRWFDAAVEAVGEQGVAELVATVGYYSLVSFALNTFDVGLPDGVAPRFGT